MLTYEKTILKIFQKIKKTPSDTTLYEDCFSLLRASIEENVKKTCTYSQELRNLCNIAIRKDYKVAPALSDLSKRTLLLEAPHIFDSYLQYLEIKRKPEERFYLPRRKVLLRVVQDLQKLVDDELDELFISMPPRVGKTTLVLFFVTWIIGRNDEMSNLYSAFSDIITNAFYRGVLEVIQDPYTYTWSDVFPNSKVKETNAKDETININRKKRYPSLTCRSLYGTLNGACDCNGFLISDDLLGGIEEALNKDRLVAAWSKVDNNLIPRAKEKAKILWVGTRWSLIDPAGLRMELLTNDSNFANRRFDIINLPALDEDEESNFDYLYNVGFGTEYYKQRRASFERNNDMASWLAQYMGEPIERDGALFSPQEMKFYNGVLPDKTPDRIFLACDVAFGGGDFLSAPVCFQYGDDVFVHDWVFDNGDKFITRPKIISTIMKYKIQAANFEKNNGGGEYQEYIEEHLRDDFGYKLNITSTYAPTTKRKEQRIFDHAPEIREFYFLEDGKRSKDYSLAMTNLYSFKITGKNKNDDAPDSLSQVCEMISSSVHRKIEIFKRPF